MTNRLAQLPADRADRIRLALFALSGVAAFGIGFVLFTPPTLERLIVHGGYYYIAAVFAAFVVFAWRVTRPRREIWLGWLRRPGPVGLALLGATLFVVWSDSFGHKVLFDEYVLQGTAWHMHATKEIGAPMRAYDFEGTWLAIDAFLDKRPYFFTFLVSLLHDLTGYRLANAYVLNVALAGLTLALTFWLARALTRTTGTALLAVALLATLPVFGQNATGASMELHNLAMIAVAMTCAVLYLRAPDADRLALLVLATALLAQCRYESVLFVVPAAIVVVAGWLKRGRLLLPWPALIAPLLLVPYVWLDRFVTSRPVLWQLREGETARFGLRYLESNLEGARLFFFNWGPAQANSLCLTLLGIAAALWGLVRLVVWARTPGDRRPAWPPAAVVLTSFAVIVGANLALLMFYYWSRLDEPITARFTLPMYFVFVLLAAWFVGWVEKRGRPALRVALGILGCWLLLCGIPAHARRLYTTLNLVMRELDWELERISSYPRPFLLITQKATLPFVLKRIPTVNTGAARTRGEEIAWHLRQGTFHQVLVSQVIRPSSAEGDAQVDPDDVLPKEFHLETLEQKRFGGRWIRISRVVEIETPAASLVTGAP